MSGSLFVVATPIGNLGDMVPRALEILQSADLVCAEDTRHSGRLLQHFGIRTPLVAHHEHSSATEQERILQTLREGGTVALISDAGTPLISDPGFDLIRTARREGITVIPVPGACAAIAALSVAGMATDRFIFEGFLPAKSAARRSRLEAVATERASLVFYESPHRILDSLQDMAAVLGGTREAFFAREMTKAYETYLFDTLDGLCDRVASDSDQQRGEIVVVVSGAGGAADEAVEREGERVLHLLLGDLPVKRAAALAARITGDSKNRLYQLALQADRPKPHT